MCSAWPSWPPGATTFPDPTRSRRLLSIALIRQRYDPHGGAERFVERALAALAGQDVRVTLLTRRWRPDARHEAIVCDPFYAGRLWRDAGFARAVCGALERHRFDLVQSHERVACCDVYRAGDGVYAEWLAQRGRSIGRLHRAAIAVAPYHRYLLSAERALFRSPRLKAVICNSRMVKDEIRERFGVAESVLHVIYSAIDGTAFHPGLRALHRVPQRQRLGIPADAVVFAFVGSGFERKGLAGALRALARTPDRAWLLAVGRDKHTARYERLAERLGVAARVRFTGGVDDVKPCYGAADAFVLPTLYDPFPNAALEAFACGLPVVTSTKSGAAELVRDGHNGHVRDALDVAGLAGALTALLDADVRTRMGAAARETIAELTPQAMADRLVALYRSLVVAPAGGSG
jgi:UDP-glucose:(heptosyl)LPS alpha-1,3-glucosyltransferase